MVDLGLEREMRRVLTDLEMTSNGVTASFDSSGGGAFGSKPPVSGGCDMRTDPPHVYWRRRWSEAAGDVERRHLLDGARGELDRIRKAPPPAQGETEEQRDKRLLRLEGFTLDEVALSMRMTPRQVRAVRMKDGRFPNNGRVNPLAAMPNATREQRAPRSLLLWREHRMSYREIAMLFGCSHETIRRDVMQEMAKTANRGAKAA